MPLPRSIGVAGAIAIALIGISAVSGFAHAAPSSSPVLSPRGFTGTVVRLEIDPRQVSVTPSPSPDASPAASPPTTPSSALPSPIRSLVASAELTTYPTVSEHPDFVTGAIFVVLSALLVAVAYVVRVLRRRLRRT